ncbi:hypothetical protein EON67_08440 [archaeon]|nr:MAG: hypothetical protein EON67_08440 [archaeon]
MPAVTRSRRGAAAPAPAAEAIATPVHVAPAAAPTPARGGKRARVPAPSAAAVESEVAPATAPTPQAATPAPAATPAKEMSASTTPKPAASGSKDPRFDVTRMLAAPASPAKKLASPVPMPVAPVAAKAVAASGQKAGQAAAEEHAGEEHAEEEKEENEEGDNGNDAMEEEDGAKPSELTPAALAEFERAERKKGLVCDVHGLPAQRVRACVCVPVDASTCLSTRAYVGVWYLCRCTWCACRPL